MESFPVVYGTKKVHDRHHKSQLPLHHDIASFWIHFNITFHVLTKLQMWRITIFALHRPQPVDDINRDKMGRTVSMHGKGEIEDMIQKPE